MKENLVAVLNEIHESAAAMLNSVEQAFRLLELLEASTGRPAEAISCCEGRGCWAVESELESDGYEYHHDDECPLG